MDIWSQMSSVVAKQAAISSDQPLANNIGLDILKMGGNAADAAVATMVAVSVVQSYACGIGGDCQCLFYKASDKKVYAINGSGRSGHNNTLDKLLSEGIVDIGYQKQFRNHGLWVSVPGTVAGMYSVVEKFGSGKLTMEQILQPAINLAEMGVPVPTKASYMWLDQKPKLENVKRAGDLLNDRRIPVPGDLLYAPKLASSLRLIASNGPEAFYSGRMAENIVQEVQSAGGVLTLQDMKEHLVRSRTEEVQDGIYADFHGFRVWEMKPNTTGIVVLVALKILKLYDLKAYGHNSAQYIHVVSEAIKNAFLECWEYLCDPACTKIPIKSVLSQDVIRRAKEKIEANKVLSDHHVITGGNTSYVAAVDQEGNGCSFICSVCSTFGARVIPEDCGFVLHDRLKSMSFNEESPNVYGPNKLPLHTIIPTIVTHSETNELMAVMGLIGRWMQPQGKIQLLLNMIIFDMDPQTALNKPRFFVGNPLIVRHFNESLSKLNLEEGIPGSVVPALEHQGYNVTHSISGMDRILFGNGNIIARPLLWNKDQTNLESWWSGADPRADGSAAGF